VLTSTRSALQRPDWRRRPGVLPTGGRHDRGKRCNVDARADAGTRHTEARIAGRQADQDLAATLDGA